MDKRTDWGIVSAALVVILILVWLALPSSQLGEEPVRTSQAGYLETDTSNFTTLVAREKPLEPIKVSSQVKTEGINQKTYYDIPLPKNLQDVVIAASAKYGVEVKLILAVAKTESNFTADAISASNDFGIMQINKVNHASLRKKLGVTNFLDAAQNINAGTYILKQLGAGKADNHTVLLRYNMGTAGARRYTLSGRSSSNYSRKVMDNYNNLKKVEN